MQRSKTAQETLSGFAPSRELFSSLMFWEILNLKVFRKANWSPRMILVLSFGSQVTSHEYQNSAKMIGGKFAEILRVL